MSASTYILCAFQDHLHPRAAAVAHVHDAHTHLPLERHNYLRRVRTQGGTLFTSSGVFLCMLGLSFSCFSISSISLLLLLHFMNYEMCNFYTATDFLRVFHRSQCARHLPQALAHSQLQSHPSPLQKFHSLPHGVALESQLLWPICASLCSLLMDAFSMCPSNAFLMYIPQFWVFDDDAQLWLSPLLHCTIRPASAMTI